MPPGEALCLSCGMCCDGSLFARVDLAPGEGAPLGHPGRDAMPQPCRQLGPARACAVYAARPTKCRAYTCHLFDRVATGAVTPAFAASVVACARDLQRRSIAASHAAMGARDAASPVTDASSAFLDLIARSVEHGVADRPAFDEAVFHWNVVKHYVRKHFEPNYCPDPTPRGDAAPATATGASA